MFKIGDRVKIKSNRGIIKEININGHAPGFYPPMDDLCGKKAKIVGVYEKRPVNNIQWVYLDIDQRHWVWSVNWLIKINRIEINNNLFLL